MRLGKILLIGTDEQRLRERLDQLQTLGLDAEFATSEHLISERLSNELFELAIVYEPISEVSKTAMVRRARQIAPTMPILLVADDLVSTEAPVDATMIDTGSPSNLLNVIRFLVLARNTERLAQ